MLTTADAAALIEYTSQEEKYLKLFENSIDAALMKFVGAPLPIKFDQLMTTKLAYKLKRDYEANGWRVQVASMNEATGSCVMMFTAGDSPSKVQHPLALEKAENDLGPLSFYKVLKERDQATVKSKLLRAKELRVASGRLMRPIVEVDETFSVAAIQRLHALECKILVSKKPSMTDIPDRLLSILICTIPSRREMCRRLVEYIESQVRHYSMFEIITDEGEGKIGAKRQRLLEKATGMFVAFVDDDDMVSVDYVERICKTIVENPDATHLSLVGEVTTDGGQKAEKFLNSVIHERWNDVRLDGEMFYERTPSHLSPIRRDIALKVGYRADLNYIEDRDFSDRLRPLLTNEASTGDKPLYYYFVDSEQSNRSRAAYDKANSAKGAA